ncbi:hypothetical protein P805_04545 [Serratia marcescens BIDMC 44]|nr:hypothetical protein P805_04545 [Serratia marcescens BIDMC 44]
MSELSVGAFCIHKTRWVSGVVRLSHFITELWWSSILEVAIAAFQPNP